MIRERPAGREHARELGERSVEVRQVVEDGVAEHEIERLVLERKSLGVGLNRLDLEPEPLGGRREHVEHSGGDVDRGRLTDHAGAQQIEREVAGAGTDLERALVVAGLAAERLRELHQHLALARFAVVDRPLAVVAARPPRRDSGC